MIKKTLIISLISVFLWFGIFSDAAEQGLIISEIAWMGTSVSSNDEWLELENLSDKEVSLEGWTLVARDGTPSIKLSGKVEAGGLYLLERTDDETVVSETADLIYSGILSNDGEILELRDESGFVVDAIDASEEWSAGDNAAKKTMERFGLKWQNSCAVGGSPRARNVYCAPDEEDGGDEKASSTPSNKTGPSVAAETVESKMAAKYNYSDDVVLSEIFPDPDGGDEEDEWIELFNKGGDSVSLLGWQIGDDTQRRYEVGDVKLGPNKYLVLYRIKTGLALNNEGDSVKLFKPLESVAWQTVKFPKTITAWSYAWNPDKVNSAWAWSALVTPNEKNEIRVQNSAPLIELQCSDEIMTGDYALFDASDSTDPDDDKMIFSWEMGDGQREQGSLVRHGYALPGKYKIVLTVSDGELSVKKEKEIEVKTSIKIIFRSDENKDDLDLPVSSADICISEIMPDPEGGDEEGEWVEIYNNGSSRVNILDWRFDDADGGSRPYKITEDTWLDPGGFFVLDRAESKIALNNSSDSVRIFDAGNNLIDEVQYKKSKEGNAYSMIGDNWIWNNSSNPGEKNQVSRVELTMSDDTGEKVTNKTTKTKSSSSTKKTQPLQLVEISELKSISPTSRVRVMGTVLVEPGILASQYFYIADASGVGVQIYNYKKSFPKIKKGDLLEVDGELSIVNGELRVKTGSLDDMRISGVGLEVSSRAVKCSEIDDEILGGLLSVEGEIVDKQGVALFLDDDSGELRVYAKETAGLDLSGVTEGDRVKATGVLSKTQAGYRLLLRDAKDLERIGGEDWNNEQVLGIVATSETWNLAPHDSSQEKMWYILVIFLSIFGLSFWIWYKFIRNPI